MFKRSRSSSGPNNAYSINEVCFSLVHARLYSRSFSLAIVDYASFTQPNKRSNGVPKPNVLDAIISANKSGNGRHALELFHGMQTSDLRIGKNFYLAVLKSCTMTKALIEGRLIHEQIRDRVLQSDVFLGSSLVDMYAKCGSLEEACQVFDSLPNQDAVSWGALIAGYTQHGKGSSALELFGKMQQSGIEPSKMTFSSILKACASMGYLYQGRVVHHHLYKYGFDIEIIVGTALIDMYAKCGSLEEAWETFSRLPARDVISWSAMIAGYAQHGEGLLALELFRKMQAENIKPNRITFSSVIKACSSIGSRDQARRIHDQIIESKLGLDDVMLSGIIDMYAKCGSLDEACEVFDQLSKRDVVSWSAMIAGYVQHGNGLPALELYKEMQQEGVNPDKVTFLSVMKACASIGALEHGRRVHQQITKFGLVLDTTLGNTLVDMYVKCGCLVEAQKVFNELPKLRDEVSWGAMISGYAHNGDAISVFQCIKNMEQERIQPNEVIFANILVACSCVGLVDEGSHFYKSMKKDHGIMPDIRHDSCVLDLLGRAGRWNEVEILLESGIQLNVVGWTSLLNSCQLHGNAELAKTCFDEIIHSYPNSEAVYVLMANVYASTHMIDSIMNVEG